MGILYPSPSARHQPTGDRDFPVVVLDERGDAERSSLSRIVQKDFNLDYRTVILPVEAGGLDEHGMLDAKSIEPRADIDIADEPGVRKRWVRTERENETVTEEPLIPRQTTGPTSVYANLMEQHRLALRLPAEGAEDEGESQASSRWPSRCMA